MIVKNVGSRFLGCVVFCDRLNLLGLLGLANKLIYKAYD